MNIKTYKCKKPNASHAVSSLKKPINYSLNDFGFKNLTGDGLGIRICVIDTGVPNTSFIKTPASNSIDFTNTSVLDTHGHATGVSGIMVARASGNMTGLIPQSTILYAKAIRDSGNGDHGAVQASILYSIVQEVDIILMSFGCEIAHPSLKDAISKAYKNNICIIAAAGNDRSSTKDADFPARLNDVLSVGLKDAKGKSTQHSSLDSPAIDIHIDSLYTTYLNDMFIKMGGSSIAAPIVASAAACIIQKQRSKNIIMTPAEIYGQIMSYTS